MPKILRKELLINLLNDSPYGNTKKGYEGELKVLNALENHLPSSSTVIWDPIFNKYKPDLLVIDPNIGFLIVEVKNWSQSFVMNFNKNGTVLTSDGQKHPLGQTDNYINELNSFLQSSQNYSTDIYRTITSIVIFPDFKKVDFLNRPEVQGWTLTTRESFLKNHFFEDDLNPNLFQKIRNSKKFPDQLLKIFSMEKLEIISSMLGVESLTSPTPKVLEGNTVPKLQFIESNNKNLPKGENKLDVESLTSPFPKILEENAVPKQQLIESNNKRLPNKGVKKSSNLLPILFVISLPVIFLVIFIIIITSFINSWYDVAKTHHSEVGYQESHDNTVISLESTRNVVPLEPPSSSTVLEDKLNNIENEDIPIDTPVESVISEEKTFTTPLATDKDEKEAEFLPNSSLSSKEFFTLGSTKEEVESIMGTPTKISSYSNQWSYDFSTIEFNDQDLVTAWTDYDQKLKVSLGDSKGSSFTLDSTKQQVIDSMGTPSSISLYSNQWTYDLSTIDFNDSDLVVAWTDYDQKLNTNLGDAIGSSFSLGSTKQQVIDSMGTPTSISLYSNQWSYDFSTIDFSENNQVIGWSDFDGKLKVK